MPKLFEEARKKLLPAYKTLPQCPIKGCNARLVSSRSFYRDVVGESWDTLMLDKQEIQKLVNEFEISVQVDSGCQNHCKLCESHRIETTSIDEMRGVFINTTYTHKCPVCGSIWKTSTSI